MSDAGRNRGKRLVRLSQDFHRLCNFSQAPNNFHADFGLLSKFENDLSEV